jgi:hypothetical protein
MIDGEGRRRRLWEHNMMTMQVMLRIDEFERRPICKKNTSDRI